MGSSPTAGASGSLPGLNHFPGVTGFARASCLHREAPDSHGRCWLCMNGFDPRWRPLDRDEPACVRHRPRGNRSQFLSSLGPEMVSTGACRFRTFGDVRPGRRKGQSTNAKNNVASFARKAASRFAGAFQAPALAAA